MVDKSILMRLRLAAALGDVGVEAREGWPGDVVVTTSLIEQSMLEAPTT